MSVRNPGIFIIRHPSGDGRKPMSQLRFRVATGATSPNRWYERYPSKLYEYICGDQFETNRYDRWLHIRLMTAKASTSARHFRCPGEASDLSTARSVSAIGRPELK